MQFDQIIRSLDAETLAALPADGGSEYNRLIFESSPYLLQHARNPVDWYPWGEEAFQAARDQNKPLFVSIGYATCHWCHVMERESFEDEKIGELLNQYFICIKVDKEERPDIDDIYMTACQAMTGSGGWPLTAVLNHDLKPFFTGTYFPKVGNAHRPGLIDLILSINKHWSERRDEIDQSAEEISEHLSRVSSARPGAALNEETLALGFQNLERRFDPHYGGFGTRPKFPSPHHFLFLLRYGKRSGNSNAQDMVTKTLSAMRAGGIYDHVGFGFHRYSTDAYWLLPHFEKMLYDQAMMAHANLEAWQVTGQPAFAQIAREIFTYVMRDMTADVGAFYSAEDADSEGVEGKFYIWTPEQVIQILGEELGARYNRAYSILEGGNFTDEATGHPAEESIPHLKQSLEAVAKRENYDVASLTQELEQARTRLFEHRKTRIHPLKDDKILTDWNGLMIAAMAKGGRFLDDHTYLDAAAKAANYILTEMIDDDGCLYKRARQGNIGLNAHLDDYAFMIWGLLELYQATFQMRWLRAANDLTQKAIELFHNDSSGAFYLASDRDPSLIMRSQRVYDGAIPSGNSVMAYNLIRLSHMTGNKSYENLCHAILQAFSEEVASQPTHATFLLCALDFVVGPSREIVIVGSPEEAKPFLQVLRKHFLPNTVILLKSDETLAEIAAYTKDYQQVNGQATLYLCENFSCAAPVTDMAGLEALL